MLSSMARTGISPEFMARSPEDDPAEDPARDDMDAEAEMAMCSAPAVCDAPDSLSGSGCGVGVRSGLRRRLSPWRWRG